MCVGIVFSLNLKVPLLGLGKNMADDAILCSFNALGLHTARLQKRIASTWLAPQCPSE
jgi:hypothetical protein